VTTGSLLGVPDIAQELPKLRLTIAQDLPDSKGGTVLPSAT
jgi:hypothetical protein